MKPFGSKDTTHDRNIPDLVSLSRIYSFCVSVSGFIASDIFRSVSAAELMISGAFYCYYCIRDLVCYWATLKLIQKATTLYNRCKLIHSVRGMPSSLVSMVFLKVNQWNDVSDFKRSPESEMQDNDFTYVKCDWSSCNLLEIKILIYMFEKKTHLEAWTLQRIRIYRIRCHL